MLINLKVKTLDSRTHEFSDVNNEITVREFKDQIAEKTGIAPDQQRIIYCGRVLADERHLKEFDVDNKVLHVAERPPPSQRVSSSSATNDSATQHGARGMRNSPLFRALDGMVVGTMAIPANGQAAIHPLTASTSFCMNRITVARHMINCANNIAAYLEDPSRGINNTSLDILARGRWTMESTVVEVGISTADIPQNQSIVNMVQGAVSAALRRNLNTNVTVLQLPTVFGTSDSDGGQAATGANEPIRSAAVIVEDVGNEDDNVSNVSSNIALAGSIESNSNSSSNISTNTSGANALPGGVSISASVGTNTDENNSQARRTGTHTLADVYDELSTVRDRLRPFVDLLYEHLRNEPVFEEDEDVEREDAQRLFDRTSEALHYLAHAEHAISDLMLDYSQSTPRFLTCRPVLVEQSGYTANVPIVSMEEIGEGNHARSGPNISTLLAGAQNANNRRFGRNSSNAATNTVEDPVDEPISPGAQTNNNDNNFREIVLQPVRGSYFGGQFQMNMARFLQAYMQINAPTIVSFGLPADVTGSSNNTNQNSSANSAGQPTPPVPSDDNNRAGANQAASQTNSSRPSIIRCSSGSNVSANTNTAARSTGPTAQAQSGNHQARVNTATLPTTSTQTRSTSRPQQIQVGGIPGALGGSNSGWNGRFIPQNGISAFDRFLPCNSHHIRDTNENNTSTDANATNTNANATATDVNASAATATPAATTRVTAVPRNVVSSGATSTSGASVSQSNGEQRAHQAMVGNRLNMTARDIRDGIDLAELLLRPGNRVIFSNSGSNNALLTIMRTQLYDFLMQKLFSNAPVTTRSVADAVGRTLNWFSEQLVYLAQYETPEFDARASMLNIVRITFPRMLEVVCDRSLTGLMFERQFKMIIQKTIDRFYKTLCVCTGRENADLFWIQFTRDIIKIIRGTFTGELLDYFLQKIRSEIPANADNTNVDAFIVHKGSKTGGSSKNSAKENKASEGLNSETPSSSAQSSQKANEVNSENPQPMETDAVVNDIESKNREFMDFELPEEAGAIHYSSSDESSSELENELPHEPWHDTVPAAWIPIITKDSRQQSMNPIHQQPLSDGYISGMSAKRRKMLQANKTVDVKTLINTTVRNVIQSEPIPESFKENRESCNANINSASGMQLETLEETNPDAMSFITCPETMSLDESRGDTENSNEQAIDTLSMIIAEDDVLQTACAEAIKTNIRERCKDNEDFESDKYPKLAKIIKDKK